MIYKSIFNLCRRLLKIKSRHPCKLGGRHVYTNWLYQELLGRISYKIFGIRLLGRYSSWKDILEKLGGRHVYTNWLYQEVNGRIQYKYLYKTSWKDKRYKIILYIILYIH